MKILIHKDDLHTNFGVIKDKDIKKAKNGSKVVSNIKEEFIVLEPSFDDLIKRIKRGPQIMITKDIGYILTNTGITKDSTVLEAGAGSGYLTSFLSIFCKKVISYERNKEFFKLVNENIKFIGLKNIEIKNKDVYKKIDEKELDLIILDLPEPWNAIENAFKALKKGYFLVCYLPTINQVIELLKKNKTFIHVKTVEIIEREWQIDEGKVRPVSSIISHTGFMVFLRKI
ncbi:methyltransferase domain-containing protein [Candidatus Woesearchaeota archaeon]|nr:methyltransferase domain-containing protein [Candidatus Woesearchaeota archaeon]